MTAILISCEWRSLGSNNDDSFSSKFYGIHRCLPQFVFPTDQKFVVTSIFIYQTVCLHLCDNGIDARDAKHNHYPKISMSAVLWPLVFT